MNLTEFAKTILFGSTIEEKLAQFSLPSEQILLGSLEAPLAHIPDLPGRPKGFSRKGKTSFPSLQKLHQPETRAQILHFFANHELLALELMALMLLKFPESPPSFQAGLVKIMKEEQNHLRLYLSRMNELGMNFGDLPANYYFWNLMKNCETPLSFVIQMSLTFEQANLDYSYFFMEAVKHVGDQATGAILERVFNEEIGHVKHGLVWFNRWRPDPLQESDWQAYLRLLPSPLSPQRAKGLQFCEEARRKAGFSEQFIKELKIFRGSKGRPPVLWFYNPHCDAEIARGSAGYSPTRISKRVSQDLESIPAFLALESDLLVVRNRPSLAWIEAIQTIGFSTPEFLQIPEGTKNFSAEIRPQKLAGFQPWGWSPEAWDLFRPLQNKLIEIEGGNSAFCKNLFQFKTFNATQIGTLFSKAWSSQFLKEWLTQNPQSESSFGSLADLGESCTEFDEVVFKMTNFIKQGRPVMIKAPYGTAGNQVKKLSALKDLQSSTEGWIKNVLSSQGSIIIEPYLEKLFDLSIQMEIEPASVRLFEVKRFLTGSRHEYKGSFLGKKLFGFEKEHSQFLHTHLPEWHRLLRDLGKRLRETGYLGPAGVDSLFWKDSSGNLKLKPLVELNPRWTMGRVAIQLEKLLMPTSQGIWLFMSRADVQKQGYQSFNSFADSLTSRFPVEMSQSGGSARIQSGIVFTNDPAQAREVLSVLAVGTDSTLDDTFDHFIQFLC